MDSGLMWKNRRWLAAKGRRINVSPLLPILSDDDFIRSRSVKLQYSSAIFL